MGGRSGHGVLERANLTGTALLGNWTDAVYLSADAQWDITDALLATVPHTGGLEAGQPYTASATVVIPGRLPGNYRILVRADVYNQDKEGADEADNVIANPTFTLDVHQLPTDETGLSGQLIAGDRFDFYAVETSPGDTLWLNLDAQGGTNGLYVTRGAGPTHTKPYAP